MHEYGFGVYLLQVTVAAYHDTKLLRMERFHGFILVYSVERRASLANLR